MEFTGRITADAKISNVQGDKEVVNFSVALNDRFRAKGSTETKEYVTYIEVAWWKGTGIGKILKKGAVVTVSGRVFPRAYLDLKGNPRATINCFASDIKLIHSKKQDQAKEIQADALTEPIENLPF